MLDITGAGAQLPVRSHWKLRPGPQSHKTASSNASASGQTQQAAMQALQGKHSHSKQQSKRYKASGKRPSNCNLRPCTAASKGERADCSSTQLNTFTLRSPHFRPPVHHHRQALGPQLLSFA